MTEDEFRERLECEAAIIQNDIKSDHPDAPVEYDVYVGWFAGNLVGVIDMGESYQMVWTEDETNPGKLIEELGYSVYHTKQAITHQGRII